MSRSGSFADRNTISASQITAYTLLSDTTSSQVASQVTELPKYRPRYPAMGRDTPAVTNTEMPPASYYDPYPAFGLHNQEIPQQRIETNGRVAVQQNDKSGDSAIPISLLGRYQAPVECPACSRRTVTVVKHKNGKGTQLVLPFSSVTRERIKMRRADTV
jgi:hypothetical protein